MDTEMHEQSTAQVAQTSSLYKVTPLSKYLALALFVLLPFVGGYVGYRFAPERIVEVEKIVTKEVPLELGKDVVDVLPTGVTLYQDIKTTYISLSEQDKYLEDQDYSYPDIKVLFNGEVKEDSLSISPDRKFIQFHGYSCSTVLGGHCLGQAFVYDVEANSAHQIEVLGDESAPYNIAESFDLINPLHRYGSFAGWNEKGLVLNVTYEGQTYTYQSANTMEPWVLQYLGITI